MLEKMIRMGELYDFYGQLLTPRQQEFMDLYYRNDLSLGEVAEKFEISRQAVYDHLRRGEKLLEDYEAKLQLLARTEEIKQRLQVVRERTLELDCDSNKLEEIIDMIDQILDI